VRLAQLTRAAANGEADQQSAASGAIASRPTRAETMDEATASIGEFPRTGKHVQPGTHQSWLGGAESKMVNTEGAVDLFRVASRVIWRQSHFPNGAMLREYSLEGSMTAMWVFVNHS